ncbi:AMP-binding protein [Leekyejoonella antrihumi]|uniref:AMP-binding protein n=1 Tax=Leekyejoonella antrihumi TaxID=1660198 RepID=A0A563E505_9MICO|nr:AMP-binding protein [Leekyejoonella antrihumi]TWP37586.1 AMP-binding protein [Leekyejoonella antrihumi]
MQVEAGSLTRLAAVWFGAKTALTAVAGDGTTSSQSFAELNESANRIGSGMVELGVRRGDRVGVLAYNTPEVFQIWLGCEKHNLVREVLHTHIAMDDHVWSLDHVGATALLFDTRFTKEIESCRSRLQTVKHLIAIGPDAPEWAVPYADVVAAGRASEPLLDVDENAANFLQLSSGTTGHPKPWVKTYRSWQAVIDHNLHHFDTFGPGIPPVGLDDVNLHFHALQWAAGFQTLYPYLIRGARSVLLDDAEFDPEVIVDTILREGVTATFAPGPLWGPILDEVEKRGGIDHRLRRVVIFFGTPDLLDRTTKLLGPVWAHGFGSTEQGAITTRLLPHELDGHPERRASVGRSGGPFFEIAIKDQEGNTLAPGEVGEIAVRSAMSLGEYWGMPEKTAEATFPGDWFRPFDVGYLDEDGYLYYADRAVDTITIDGAVVYPHLVEAAVTGHPDVANCGVIGMGEPDRQSVVAVVQLRPGCSPDDELTSSILAFVRSTLTERECPARIEYRTELPTVLGGAKVQRAELRTQLTGAGR